MQIIWRFSKYKSPPIIRYDLNFVIKIWNILVRSNFGVQSLVKRAFALKRPQLLVKLLMITLWKDELCLFLILHSWPSLFKISWVFAEHIGNCLSLSLISTKKPGRYFDARSIKKIRWVGVFVFFFQIVVLVVSFFERKYWKSPFQTLDVRCKLSC